MRYAYFPGCKIAHHLPAYGLSVQAVCSALNIDLEPVEFNCCGYPVRHESQEAWALSAARNFALATRAGLPIMTPCKCCFGSLRHAQYWLEANPGLRDTVTAELEGEGLQLPKEPVRVAHLLTVLDSDVGVQALTERAGDALAGLRVAAHYGCHALRPGNVTEFDDPLNPTVFERLLCALGAEPVPWEMRLECCGHPLRGRREAMSDALRQRKMNSAAQAGAAVLATACTYCQMQFSHAPETLSKNGPEAVLFSQLLGLALGLPRESLGLAHDAPRTLARSGTVGQ